jgi:hypothetical protein
VEVEFPDGLESIGAEAFWRCTSLLRIYVPPNVTTVGESAFKKCFSMKEVHLSEGLRTIGRSAFFRCTSLLRIDIPSSVAAIDSDAFYKCTSLSVVNLSEGLRIIGQCAFQQCTSLICVDIPTSVAAIDDEAFHQCTSLSVVNLSEGLRTIGRLAFSKCTSLLCVDIPSNVTEIGNWAFEDCISLKEVNLSKGLRSIGQGAFFHCTSLLRIDIPSNVTAIDRGTFQECTSLKEVILNNSCREIGENAFNQCTSLVRINIPSNVTAIGECAFCQCISLSHIDIPSNVTTIGKKAFFRCTALKEVNLSEGLRTIGGGAFIKCTSLLRINIPSTVTSILSYLDARVEMGAFEFCPFLRNVFISPISNMTQRMFARSFPILRNMGYTLDMMIGRFNELPLHRLCYFPPSRDQTMKGTTHHGMFNEIGHRLVQEDCDCMGMTPLHVLSYQGNCDFRLYQCIIQKYPDALITKDIWGELPLTYALFGGAPLETICFFLDAHRVRFNLEALREKKGSTPVDFGEMILMLAKKQGTSAEYVRGVIRSQRSHFRCLEVDWRRVVDESIECNLPVVMFAVLVEASVSRRSICMSAEHQIEINQKIEAVTRFERRHYEEIRDMITSFVKLHHEQLMEATTILELVLWKTLLQALRESGKIVSSRECRTNEGRYFEVVIPHVLSFL